MGEQMWTPSLDGVTNAAVRELIELLDVRPDGPDVFVGMSPPRAVKADRIFGGQVAAQSLAAACKTVADGRQVASIQATFLRAGRPDQPLRFTVDRLGDGRSFAFRRVQADQDGRVIFSLSATFHRGDHGPEHDMTHPQIEPMSVAQNPLGPSPIMILEAFDFRLQAATADDPQMTVALRIVEPVADDPVLQACLTTYASDLFILEAAVNRHGISGWGHGVYAASIDHAVHFHQSPRIDDWVIYRLTSPLAAKGRAFITGQMLTADGQLFASVIQQGLMRYLD